MFKNKFGQAVLLCTSLFWIACGGGNKAENPSALTAVLSPAEPAILGAGYDTYTESVKQPCVAYTDKDLVYTGQPRADISFSKKEDFRSLEDKLNVAVSGKLKLPSYGVKGAAQFLSEAKKSEKSISLTFGNSITGKTVLLNNPPLSAEAADLAKSRDAEKIRKRCGDQYLQGIDLGAALWVNVRIDFLNADVKSKFEAEIDFDIIDLFAVAGKAEVLSKQVKSLATISVSAMQLGGDVTKLSHIFSDQSNSAAEIPLLRCSLSPEGLPACMKALNAVVKYASTDFPAQLRNWNWGNDRNPESNPDPQNGGPAVMRYRLLDYAFGQTRSLWPEPSPLLDRVISDARESLLKKYEVLLQDRNKYETFILLNIDREERKQAEDHLAVVERNKDLVMTAAISCYDRPTKEDCLPAKEYALANQKDYDINIINRPLRFREYCMLEAVSPQAKRTVERIREVLVMPKDSCSEVSDRLVNTANLDLSAKEDKDRIKDLRPLRSLTKLTRLNISNNGLSDIFELHTLTALKVLKARDNQILALSGLDKLKNLEELDLAYNAFYDASEIADLSKLTSLTIHGNPLTDFRFADQLKLTSKWLSEEQICESLRAEALKRNLVSLEDYNFYKSVGFAPEFFVPTEPSNNIEGWVNCKVIASSF